MPEEQEKENSEKMRLFSEFVAADAEAAELLADLYPGREIVMLNIDPVGEVGGGIHCATHEQPKV